MPVAQTAQTTLATGTPGMMLPGQAPPTRPPGDMLAGPPAPGAQPGTVRPDGAPIHGMPGPGMGAQIPGQQPPRFVVSGTCTNLSLIHVTFIN